MLGDVIFQRSCYLFQTAVSLGAAGGREVTTYFLFWWLPMGNAARAKPVQSQTEAGRQLSIYSFIGTGTR